MRPDDDETISAANRSAHARLATDFMFNVPQQGIEVWAPFARRCRYLGCSQSAFSTIISPLTGMRRPDLAPCAAPVDGAEECR